MSTVQAQLLSVTRRIATATSVIRTRSADCARLEANGGMTSDLQARQVELVEGLRKIADELEASLGIPGQG